MTPDLHRHVEMPRRRVLLTALAGLVHWLVGAQTVASQSRRAQGRGKSGTVPPPAVITGRGVEGLPPAVADMRAAIIAAVETGDVAELKGAMDLNELKPELGGPAGGDPIAYLRSVSADGQARDILALLGRMLEGSWAAIPGGRDIENNRIYVWPLFAEVPLAGLDEAQRAELAGLVGPDKAKSMLEAGRWQGWRLSIGADGVWHMFMRIEP